MKNFFQTILITICCQTLILAICCITSSYALTSCDNNNDGNLSDILKFSSEKVNISVEEADTITVSGGTAPFSVASSNAAVASVKTSNNAIIIDGITKGSAIIAVSDKNNFTGRIPVTVTQLIETLSFDNKSISININADSTVTVSGGTAPYTASAKDISIASATVNGNKITVKGLKEGSTNITVTDSNKKIGIIKVLVTDPAKTLGFDKQAVSIKVGNSDVVTITSGTSPYAVTVKDPHTAVTTLDGNKITITGVKAGNTNIIVVDNKRKSGTIKVTITK